MRATEVRCRTSAEVDSPYEAGPCDRVTTHQQHRQPLMSVRLRSVMLVMVVPIASTTAMRAGLTEGEASR